MLVMTGHLRDILFTNYHDIQDLNFFVQILYFLTGFGHHAVIVFFVLSGFLVGGSVIEQSLLQKFSWREYLIKRTTRIYVVFFLALFIGGLFDLNGYLFFNQLGIYNNTDVFQFGSELTDRDISENLSLKILIGNLSMLQTIKVPVLGSNGPLWSLANEFWYYLLFPALTGIFLGKKRLHQLTSCVLAFGILYLLPWKIILYFTIWLLGAFVRIIGCVTQTVNVYLSFLFFISCLALIRIFGNDSFWLDLTIAATFSLTLISMQSFGGRDEQFPLLRLRFNKFMADFSFSLYVFHFPFILFSVNVLNFFTGMKLDRQPSIFSFLIFFLLMIIVYGIAFIMAQITEKKTSLLRQYLINLTNNIYSN
jgi:peptidoglycan/LPS O-acetylase OafA/YrhL